MVGGRRSPRGARLVVQERTRRAAAVGGFGLAGDAASGFENSKFDPQRPSNAAHTWTEGSVLLCRTGVPQIPAVIEIRRFPIIKIAPVGNCIWIPPDPPDPRVSPRAACRPLSRSRPVLPCACNGRNGHVTAIFWGVTAVSWADRSSGAWPSGRWGRDVDAPGGAVEAGQAFHGDGEPTTLSVGRLAAVGDDMRRRWDAKSSAGPGRASVLILAIFLLARNYVSYNKKSKEFQAEDSLRKAESSSIQGVIEESANNISNVIRRTQNIYSNAVTGLAKQDLELLKKNKKQGAKLADEIEDLRNHIFYFIKNLDESSVRASDFYISTITHLTDVSQSLDYISKVSHKHVNNNHKKLKYNQLKELKELENLFEEELFTKTKVIFENRNFNDIGKVLAVKPTLLKFVSEKIETQVARIRTEETSPKNSTLYFSILLETRDLLNAIMTLLELYYRSYDADITPASVEE